MQVRHIRRGPRLRIGLIQIDRLRRPLLLRIPRVVHAQIRRNPVQPRRELRFRPIRLPRTVYPQENLLRQLLRHGLIMHHAIHEVDDRLPVLLDQEVEPPIVAFPHPEHDLRIGHRPPVARLASVLPELTANPPGSIPRSRAAVAISLLTPSGSSGCAESSPFSGSFPSEFPLRFSASSTPPLLQEPDPGLPHPHPPADPADRDPQADPADHGGRPASATGYARPYLPDYSTLEPTNPGCPIPAGAPYLPSVGRCGKPRTPPAPIRSRAAGPGNAAGLK